MKAFKERLERTEVEEPVHIPTLDESGIAETVMVKVPAWRDPKDGEIYFDEEATAMLDKVKARHMGLLTPEQIKKLRERLKLTQKEISQHLQLGEKSWSRWETGRERPSRMSNVLLWALYDGKIDSAYLRTLARRRNDWSAQLNEEVPNEKNPWIKTVELLWKDWEPATGSELVASLQEDVAKLLAAGPHQTAFPFGSAEKGDSWLAEPNNVIRMHMTRQRPPEGAESEGEEQPNIARSLAA